MSDQFYYLNLLKVDKPGYISQLGHVKPDPSYALVKRNMRCHFFDYVLNGHGYIEHEGKTARLEAGDLVYAAKGADLSYGADKRDPYEKLWLGACGPAVDLLTKCYLGDRQLVIRKNSSPAPFNELRELTESRGHDDKEVMRILLRMIMSLSETAQSEQNSRRRGDAALKLRDYIDDHLCENLSLDAAAESFHLSKRHLIRVFKERFNETPGSYHTGERLEASRRYLTETSYTIGEISAQLGFCDQSFFSSSFKKRYGIYPTAYRRKYQS